MSIKSQDLEDYIDRVEGLKEELEEYNDDTFYDVIEDLNNALEKLREISSES